jgi:hypothetical protein
MFSGPNLTTADILGVFTEEIVARQGQVTDTFDDGQRLLTRSVLPHIEEVRAGDKLQGGVALKATEQGVWLYPYLFRLVCRNGAIIVSTIEARALTDLHLQDPDSALESIREGVEACSSREGFSGTIRRVCTACEMEADLVIALLPFISKLSARGNSKVLAEIMDRFFRESDRSRFGLANAITSLARDTRDPLLRWDLEELGGGVALGAMPSSPADRGGSQLAEARRLVSVG